MFKAFTHFFYLLLFFIISQACLAQNRDDYKLLWEIDHQNNTKKSYLFGTMHVKDERAFKFSDALIPALEKSEMFALEIHPDSVTNSLGDNFFASGLENSFKRILTADEYKRLSKRFYEINGIEIDSFPLQHPLMIEAMLSEEVERETDKRTFLDAYLFGIANNLDKQITGLEKVEDQLPPIESIDDEEIRRSVLEILNSNAEERNLFLEKLTDIYYRGDIEEILTFATGLNAIDKIMKKRNITMANSMDKIMQQSSVFAAVGTAHLPGKFGIIELLREKGYEVRKVEATFDNPSEEYKIVPNLKKWHIDDNSELGLRVATPTKSVPLDVVDKVRTMTATDLIYGGTFTYMAIDLRETGYNKDFDYVENIIKNQIDESNEELISQKDFKRNGIDFTEILIKKGKSITRMQIALANSILYSFFIENSIDEINSEYANAFFDSIFIYEPKFPASVWKTNKNDLGAYSISVPGQVQDLSRIVPNPNGDENTLYDLKIFTSQDKEQEMLYLLRYNDQPMGYYIDNEDDYLAYFNTYFSERGTMLGEPKAIEIDGHKGFEYEVALSDKYNTLAKVILRGNRTFMMLAQKLNETEKVPKENKFFKSFSFNTFEKTVLDTIITSHQNYRFNFRKESQIETDTLYPTNSEFNSSITYSTTSPTSGGVYNLQQLEFKKYAKHKSVDQFYTDYLQTLLETGDTIVSNKSIEIQGNEAREVLIHNKNTHIRQRMRLLLHENVLSLLLTYLSEEELEQGSSDAFFNSFVILNKSKTKFDITSSKSNEIFKNLKSKDSVVFENAINAFNYYIFTSEDYALLKKNLNRNYGDNVKDTRVKQNIINELFLLDEPNTLATLKEYYRSGKAANQTKITILEELPLLSDPTISETFFELIEEDKPIRKNNSYDIFYRLSDSISLFTDHQETTLKLIETNDFRDKLLEQYTSKIQYDSSYVKKTTAVLEKFMSYSMEDIENYVQLDLRNTYDYLNYQLIHNYINLIEVLRLDDPEYVDILKTIAQSVEDRNWLKTEALFTAIELNMDISPQLMTSAFQDLYSRFELMELMISLGRSSEIPQQYLEQEELAKLSLFNSVGNSSDAYPDEITYLGEMDHLGKKYLVYNYGYSSASEATEKPEKVELYMGISEAQQSIDLDNFELNDVYFNPSDLTENWREDARSFLSELFSTE
ncbi:TraB/GumN family protein [Ulvibacter antarcticus]|uniref:Uncharacterized protein YbaP (TraB family) n=1 Tax=Ulvibacter antarcticus TaxID=442714 RepID=A0A3L9YEL2_9FLAO|nr:TraB/GumN family protein [Ulvibacter antarcticus]RMA58824.1 uncharacterized protein YbaP (TraB family) [Ulvibacter antarcticus]